jgi:hypothetical protein
MTRFRSAVHNIFVWSYERGTLQYDVICALILAFIFIVPRGCFVAKRAATLTPSYQSAAGTSQNATTAETR